MPNLLAPTVGQRLAKCGDQVLVYGIMPGADVTLRVNASEHTQTVTGTAHTFTLAIPLVEHDRVAARQRLGPDESDWGPDVEVEDVELPPDPPLTEPSIPRCGNSVRAWGVAPGSQVLLESRDLIADGVAGRDGSVCLQLRNPPHSGDGAYASTITCGTDSSTRRHLLVHYGHRSLPAPVIIEPVFGCQNQVPLDVLIPGARVDITVTDENGAGRTYSFNTCWNRVNAGLGQPLRIGDRITARQSMARQDWDCNMQSPDATEVRALRPDERIKPTILAPVYEGDQIIYVINQLEGGMITVFARAAAHDPEEDLGSRPSSEFAEVPVSTLRAGQILRVAQELCTVVEYSDPVTVQPRPTQIEAPTVRAPLYACGSVLIVDDVIPGAMVYVLQSTPHHTTPEYSIGFARANGSSVEVAVFPVLRAYAFVSAYQVVGGQPSSRSPRVIVNRLERLPAPTVVPPVQAGSRWVWVAGIIPGAYVRIFDGVDDGANQIGGSAVGTTSASIPVYMPISGNAVVRARQVLCLEQSAASPPVGATTLPCEGPPQYDPVAWNDSGLIQCCNNCYNYACNTRTDNFAQPGMASSGSNLPYGHSCDGVSRAALEDGLRRCTDTCHPCAHKVALALSPGDYHWYRQDQNGRWSHKPGVTEATDLDNSTNPITDPASADRGAYGEFCGYFCVYKPDVVIRGPGCPRSRCDYWV